MVLARRGFYAYLGSSGGAWAVGCPVTAGLPATASCLQAAVVPLRGRRPQLAYACLGVQRFQRFGLTASLHPSAFYSPRGPLRAARTRRKDPAH